MSQIVEDFLNVTPVASPTASIELQGNSATIRAGGASSPGDLRLADAAGVERALLKAGSAALELYDAAGVLMAELAATGNLTLGASGGNSGDLFLKDSAGVKRVELSAQHPRIRIRDASGNQVASVGPLGDLTLGGASGAGGNIDLLDQAGQKRVALAAELGRLRLLASDGTVVAEIGATGNLTLGGGGGTDGDVSLKDSAGVERFRLDAENNLLTIRDAEGEQIVRLGDGANLRLGGGAMDGDVRLDDTHGTTRIELDAASQQVRVRNAEGEVVVQLGANGNLVLGTNGSDGDVNLHDGAGQLRVQLEADGNAIRCWDSAGRQTFSFGGNSNLRLGGNDTDGDLLLFPSSANDIFSDADATIHLDADAGDITLRNADCAEEFEVLPDVEAEAGTVMALGNDGRLGPTGRAYETAVVGVVSGAGHYKPGIVLDKQVGAGKRRPIALMGKTFVKVCDENGPIQVGDLLASSSLKGHAMRVGDPRHAVGSIIGKAIMPHARGRGLIAIVIALQ